MVTGALFPAQQQKSRCFLEYRLILFRRDSGNELRISLTLWNATLLQGHLHLCDFIGITFVAKSDLNILQREIDFTRLPSLPRGECLERVCFDKSAPSFFHCLFVWLRRIKHLRIKKLIEFSNLTNWKYHVSFLSNVYLEPGMFQTISCGKSIPEMNE